MLEQITLSELNLLLQEFIKKRDIKIDQNPERTGEIVVDTMPISRVLRGTIEELKKRGDETIEFDKCAVQKAINLLT